MRLGILNALGAAAAVNAITVGEPFPSDLIDDGPSRTDREREADRLRAKADRDSWTPAKETRQQRRARERAEFKRRTRR